MMEMMEVLEVEDLVTWLVEDGECESIGVAEAGGWVWWPEMI